MLHCLARWAHGISCGSGWLGIGVQVWASPRETCGYKLGTLNIQIQSLIFSGLENARKVRKVLESTLGEILKVFKCPDNDYPVVSYSALTHCLDVSL